MGTTFADAAETAVEIVDTVVVAVIEVTAEDQVVEALVEIALAAVEESRVAEALNIWRGFMVRKKTE
ncbi:hypothetical protein CCR75_005487 [Bremia lactucae]|uniref:Uncharacterized protein n=1 Tax=Bremia lactucae TaxID=4779 RepID=A0A976IFL4_BRELC|nr:hypothetical protein CCR75_005487 [Bremia lactucae]